MTSLGRFDSVDDSRCEEVVQVCTQLCVMMIMSHCATRLLYISSSQLAVHCRCAISPSNQDYVGVGVKSSDQREERDSRQTDGDINKNRMREREREKET